MSVRGYELDVDWDGDSGLTRLVNWADWGFGDSSGTSLSISTVRSHSGADSMLVTWAPGGVSVGIFHDGLTAGVTYILRGWVYVPAASMNHLWAIDGGVVGTSSTRKDTWEEITLQFTATQAIHQLQIRPATTPAAKEQVWIDDTTIEVVGEDVTPYLLKSPSLQLGYGRDKAQGLSPMASGTLSFALWNKDRRFSPENTSSPISGYVLPGRPVQLRHTDTDSTVILFEGVLDDFDISTDTPAREFAAQCLDAWGRPSSEALSTRLYAGLRTGDAIGVILNEIGWPIHLRDVDPGATIMPWWWVEGDDAATAVQNLVDSEGPPAVAYVEGGTFVYRDRHHRLLRTASQTAQATFSYTIPPSFAPGGSLKVLRGPQYDRGLRNIVNSVTFALPHRRPGSHTVVWSSDETFQLSSGETEVVDVQTDDPVFAAEVPVAGIDYTLVSGTVLVSLSRDSGQSIAIFITAVGGAAIVSGLELRATPVRVARTQKVSSEDSTSIATHGRRGYEPTSGYAGIHDARAIARHVVGVYSQPRRSVSVSIANLDDTYMDHIRMRRISDRVRIINDDLGLDSSFHIERIDHDIRGLNIHTATFGCEAVEPAQPTNVFQFDTAGRGFDDGVFGYSGIDDPASVWIWDHATQGKFDVGQFAS